MEEKTGLVSQLRSFKMCQPPYDSVYNSQADNPLLWWSTVDDVHPYLEDMAIQLFSVVPSQASCERNFSTLKWLSGGNRQSLSLETLEKIAKNRAYLMSNVKSSLRFSDPDLSPTSYRIAAVNENVMTGLNFQDLFSEINYTEDENFFENAEISSN